MTPTPLIFAATCDLAGKVRGKAFPADQLDKRLVRGVGWTPTNVLINCFDGIGESPFGALGDLLLIPDATAEVRVDFGAGPAEHFMLADIVTLEGKPWEFCTRSLLKSALHRLHRVSGVRLISAFEHEFQLKGKPAVDNQGFGREGFELQRALCETLVAALQRAGIDPDSIMKEYGPNQYEVVVGPDEGVRSADAAVILRELTRSAARSMGQKATFTPIRDVNSVGNGVHIHMSFINDDGKPVTYDENGACGMSQLTSAFSAGVLKYLENIIALTAPSVVSYERLTPHRWSAAYNNLGFRDREASLRVCPVTAKDPASIARQFNIEYRAAAAAACPHMALAAIVHAGCQGIEEGLVAPAPTEEDLSLLSPKTLAERGFVRLPKSLEAALEQFEANPLANGWFGKAFAPVYRAHKASEIAYLADMDTDARCAAYEETY
ncbi:glutamine synthetase family protein [Sedimentitalea todarodis]|uniref:Glutamine synthetase family protein n=1 Tax=Sedimentitalea todarodis TaxID=1631240 RepID=A0ABU3VGK7_9RHOB|nr:glutamine synthetase family protein [Sedimentitalea todarodis]MDU9005314.1 glutamine synthetase family protein [Sedimentitalea todarodis]